MVYGALSRALRTQPSLTIYRTMSVFMKKVNPITGKMEWEVQDEDYDYHQEIARSAYADMLHDTERNVKYQIALEAAINKMHRDGKEAHVLDIGTGTGLLSMMAACAGADTIVACEAFEPMGKCAQQVIKENGFANKIKVIPKRSTQLTVGMDGDLPRKANILVTEVFDTELIGEGAYSTFSHAHKELLEKDCIVVPSSGTVYAQVVESKLVSGWNTLRHMHKDEEKLIDTPPDILSCPGAAAVHDIQMSQISPNDFKTILRPEAVFRFDWSGRAPLVKDRSCVQVLKAAADGKAQAVFMWWDLVMDTEGKVILSCAPFWAHPSRATSAAGIPWRDHWMQAVYYLPREVLVKEGQELTLISSHDEYSLWFNLGLDLKVKDVDYERPVCQCGAHVALSRTRIGQLNDEQRTKKYLQAIAPLIKSESVCVSLSDSSLLGLAAAKMGAKKVYCIESNALCRKVLEKYVAHNKLQEKVNILAEPEEEDKVTEMIPDKVDLILGEPYYMSSILPWENIHFWYMKAMIKSALAPSYHSLPVSATVYGIAVEFSDLWKIRAPLGEVQGFGMKCFDELIEHSSDRVDGKWEAQPLWEYPCQALSLPERLLCLPLDQDISNKPLQSSGRIPIKGKGKCHGMALWVDWDLDRKPENIVTTGPTRPVQLGQQVCWDIHTRQGVYLIQDVKSSTALTYSVDFIPHSGSIMFSFKPETGDLADTITEVKIVDT